MSLVYEAVVSKIKEYLAENDLGNFVKEDYKKKYEEFYNLFGPEVLEKLEGSEVRDKIFMHDGDHNNLCWFLEKSPEFGEFNGRISGGASQKFSLFKSQDGQWKAGLPKKSEVISEDEAIEVAINIRDSIIEGAKHIKTAQLNSKEDYVKLGTELNEIFNNCLADPTHAWIHKYYSIIFPERIPGCHKEETKEDMIKKLSMEPSKEFWAKDGQLALLSKDAEIELYSLFDENVVGLFYVVDNDVWDDLKRKNLRYDESTNYWIFCPDESATYYDLKKDSKMTVGFKEIGDFNQYNKRNDIEKEFNRQKIKVKNPKKQAEQIFDFCNNIKINDIVYVIKKSQNKNILLGCGTVTSDYQYDENITDNHKSYREIEWKKTSKRDVSDYKFGQNNLINITDNQEKIDYCKGILDSEITPIPIDKPVDVSKENFKRNLIYFGAPGTGKSHKLNEEAKKFKDNVERVTFHENYSYANFVGTYKPKPTPEGKITYEYVPGPFMNVLTKALTSKNEEDYLLIIEEINRANPATVFGDVFQLLDREENGESKFPVSASEDIQDYLKKVFEEENVSDVDSDKLFIPKNMYIWATMNSADQGVFPMDTAFKRRWDFEYMGINKGEKVIENIEIELPGQKFKWNDLRRAINTTLTKDYYLNEDKCLGPFFAFHDEKYRKTGIVPPEDFIDTFKNKVIMYLFEDAARSKRDELFSNAKDDGGWITLSEIYEKFGDETGGEYIKIFHDDIIKEVLKDDEREE